MWHPFPEGQQVKFLTNEAGQRAGQRLEKVWRNGTAAAAPEPNVSGLAGEEGDELHNESEEQERSWQNQFLTCL